MATAMYFFKWNIKHLMRLSWPNEVVMAVKAALVLSAIVTHTNILLTMCVRVEQFSSYSSCNSSRTSTCSSLCWSSRATPSQHSCSPRSLSSRRRHRASRVSPVSSQSLCPSVWSVSDCFVLPLALNRSPASPEPSNTTTSKPSQPPADPAKHHTCHTGQGYPIYPLDPFLFCPNRERVHNTFQNVIYLM